MKNSKILKRIIIVFIILIVLSFGTVFYLYKTGKINFGQEKKEKVEFQYTETVKVSDTSIDGIFITDVSQVVENVMPSIVAITSKTLINSGNFGPNYFGYGTNRYTEGAGSGIIIASSDSELYILTNNHVVEDASELTVQFIDEKTVDATIKGTSTKKDVAIIAIKKEDLEESTIKNIKIATIGNSDELKVGNGIIAIGNALGYGQSVTTGVVSALNREVTIDNYTNKMIQIDAAINGGNSGGALLNSNGEVVGINSAKYSSNSSSSASIEGIGFAIPITNIKDLIEKLINEEEQSSITLGIEGYITTSEYNLPKGFYVSKIVSGGNAEKSELEMGNIITKIDNTEVNSVSDISDVLDTKNKGDSVKLTVKYISNREYKEKEIKINLN